MKPCFMLSAALAFWSTCALAADPPAAPVDPVGEKLYAQHCVSCHTSDVHWREKRLARDWTSLNFQVRRWQGNIGVAMTDAEIRAVASHLNRLCYHFPNDAAK